MTTDERVWLDVAYAARDEAKGLGARWDPDVRRWYAPKEPLRGLERWRAEPELPDTLPNEDRTFAGSRLFVDLVPSSCWFTNVRSCLSPRDWDRLRRVITVRTGNRCEICGMQRDNANGVFLEAHERWHYERLGNIQVLRRLICLCTPCHTATHIGLAELRGHGQTARLHLAEVNGWNESEVDRHIRQAWDIWETRSAIDWELDLSILTATGIKVQRPPTRTERPIIARDQVAGQAESQGPGGAASRQTATSGTFSREFLGQCND